jgi:hypothetical protein
MTRDSHRLPTAPGEGRPGPGRIGVGSTWVPFRPLGTVGLFATALTTLVWFVDVGQLEEGARMRLIPGEPGRHNMSFAVSADGTMMATTDLDGSVTLRDARSGWRALAFPGARDHIRAMSLSPDARFLVCAGLKAGVTLYDLQSRAEAKSLPVPLDRVRIVAFSPDGQTIAVATDRDGRIALWDLGAGRVGQSLRAPGRVASLAFSSDGRSLVSGGFPPDSPIILWDLDTGRRRLRLEGKGGPVMALTLSGDGGLLA